MFSGNGAAAERRRVSVTAKTPPLTVPRFNPIHQF
jgi:hypothetical protein